MGFVDYDNVAKAADEEEILDRKRALEKEHVMMKRMQEEINYLQSERRRLYGILDAITILAGAPHRSTDEVAY